MIQWPGSSTLKPLKDLAIGKAQRKVKALNILEIKIKVEFMAKAEAKSKSKFG